MSKKTILIIKFIIVIAVGIIIANIPPTDDLSLEAMRYIGIFIAMLLGMVLKILPDYVTVLMALVACFQFEVADFSTIFSGFASTTVWMVVIIIGFATAISASGLMKRIALNVLKFFKPNYQGQVLAIMCAGTILSPLIPNMPAKVAVLAPFANSISQEIGFKPRSKGAAGFFSAMFVTSNIIGLAFMTGSTFVFMLLGLLPKEVAAEFDWIRWFVSCAAWFIVMFVGFYFFIINYYKPEEKMELPPDFIRNKLKDLGPMSGNEKFCATTLLIGIVLWITTSIHGIDSLVIAAVLFLAVIIKGLFSVADLSAKIPWVVFLIMGSIIGLSSLLTTTGVNKWLTKILAPILTPFVFNDFMLVLVVTVATYLLRYVVVSLFACLTIMFAIFTPIAASLGINPFVVVWTAYTATQVWNLSFHNTSYIQAEGMAGKMIEWKDVFPSSVAYMVINLLGNLACIPVWTMLGFLK